MDWIEGFNIALEYIEDNLDKNIDYKEISRKACCSLFYFSRIFAIMTGTSISDYIRRRRMSLAAIDLINTDEKIIEIAMKYGYNSNTSFNRAFKLIHGISPQMARKNKVELVAYPKLSLTISLSGESKIKYFIQEKNEIKIKGCRLKLGLDMEENYIKVHEFWEHTRRSQIFKDICDINDSRHQEIYGVSQYIDEDNIFYYIASDNKCEISDNIFEIIIPKSRWVVFECDSYDIEKIRDVYSKFIKEWLPFSGYEWAKLPDIEVYQLDNNIKKFEIWIAVRKKESVLVSLMM